MSAKTPLIKNNKKTVNTMNKYLITRTEGKEEVSAKLITNAISLFLDWFDGVSNDDILKVEKL